LRAGWSTLTSKSYTVAWDDRLYVTKDFEMQMRGNGDYLIWDRCTEEQRFVKWKRADDVRYFGHVYNSLVDFSHTKHDVFVFSAGDILCQDFPAFVHKVEMMMEADPDIWLMAPHFPTDPESGMPTAIVKSQAYPEMYLTAHINGLYWGMRRDLALMLLEYYEWMLSKGFMDFSSMITGHCLDWVYSAMVLLHNKKTYRDMSTEMFEVDGTSYSTKTALYECTMVRDRYIDFAVMSGYSETDVRLIYQTISGKSKSLNGQLITLEQAYPLLKNREGFNY
jgi:hypothetical protein